MTDPRCSVVVPSRNRQPALERLLASLESQSVPAGVFETVVVLDGSTDGSAEMVAGWARAGRLAPLTLVAQDHLGRAAARNRGAEEAAGRVLIFLDDDMQAAPDLVERHLAWHADDEAVAVLGHCEVGLGPRPGLQQLYTWAWYEDKFHARGRPDREHCYTDFCTGNVSVRREDLLGVAGFETAFRGFGLEDYELGHRLLGAGVRFVPDPRARALHHQETTLDATLRQDREEGANEVTLGRLHPELRGGLRMMGFPPGRRGWLCRAVFAAPGQADAVARGLRLALPVLERVSMRRRWISAYETLRAYWYWRGVSDALGTRAGLRTYRAAVDASGGRAR